MAGSIPEKILYVDDDPNILAAYRRSFGRTLKMATAEGGQEGLRAMKEDGPFAVVISDMRMPGMDGLQFLAAARTAAPHAVRMMLTGNGDVQTVVEAVNDGNIFRFLTKPCPPETLARAIAAGLHQYRLVMAERDLLQRTLTGSIKVLTEVLSLINPEAFSRADRVKRHVSNMAAELELDDIWQYQIAAMLSQIGCVTLPPDIAARLYSGKPLTGPQQEMVAAHPAIGRKLLDNIPRLEAAARRIEGQLRPFLDAAVADPSTNEGAVALGSQMLRAALDFDSHLSRGLPQDGALARMRKQEGQYNEKLLAILERGRTIEAADGLEHGEVVEITARELTPGIYAYEEIRNKAGALLVPKWQEITPALIARLRNFASGSGIKEPFRVLIPKQD